MIWLVVDHHLTRRSLAPLITARGYRVHEFDCSDEAVRHIRFKSPTLIIIDCGIRGSFDTLAAIRAQPRGRAAPVIMFSIDDRNLREQALMAGADAYVPKGALDWAELLAEIMRYAGPPQGPPTP